jgi:hypothetical protein
LVKLHITRRNVTWLFILAFLAGAVFAELTADPISDLLFFKRSSQGALTPNEQVVYWYYVPAAVYLALLVLALFLSRGRTMQAKSFAFLIIGFAGFSLIFSWQTLGATPIILVLLLFPFILLSYMLLYRTRVTVK